MYIPLASALSSPGSEILHHRGCGLPHILAFVPVCPLGRANAAEETWTVWFSTRVLQVAPQMLPETIDDLCATLYSDFLPTGEGVSVSLV